MAAKKNVLLNEMNGYEDVKEQLRRRELEYNENNPWSVEKEATYRDRKRLEGSKKYNILYVSTRKK